MKFKFKLYIYNVSLHSNGSLSTTDKVFWNAAHIHYRLLQSFLDPKVSFFDELHSIQKKISWQKIIISFPS